MGDAEKRIREIVREKSLNAGYYRKIAREEIEELRIRASEQVLDRMIDVIMITALAYDVAREIYDLGAKNGKNG